MRLHQSCMNSARILIQSLLTCKITYCSLVIRKYEAVLIRIKLPMQ